jgi:hypothetical protein
VRYCGNEGMRLMGFEFLGVDRKDSEEKGWREWLK